jgi:hypothetical protein
MRQCGIVPITLWEGGFINAIIEKRFSIDNDVKYKKIILFDGLFLYNNALIF